MKRPITISLASLLTVSAFLGAACGRTVLDGSGVTDPVEGNRVAGGAEAPEFMVPDVPVIVLYVDGLRDEILQDMVDAGQLPNFDRVIRSRAARVENAIASQPSVTFNNAASMVTGTYPRSHGIWANKWFDRERLYARNYESADRDLVNRDLRTETIYELAGGELTSVVGAAVRRGAHMPVAIDASTGGLSAGLAWSISMQDRTDRILAGQIDRIHELAREVHTWPSLVLFYFPAVDDSGHVYGSDTDEYRTSIASFDRALGLIATGLERDGLYDRTLFVLTSDHGHHPTPAEQFLDLGPWIEQQAGVPVLLAHEDDGGASYPERRERYAEARAIVTVSGERHASVHLRKGSKWSARPSLPEILAFPRETAPLNADEDLPRRLLEHAAVDLVFARDGEDAALVCGRSGRARIERSRGQEGEVFTYRVIAGEDPLDYALDDRAAALMTAEGASDRAWLEATAGLEFPDLVSQLPAAFDAKGAGDLILVAAPGCDFSEKYLGGHGGSRRDDVCIPLYFAGGPVRAGRTVPAARLVDVVPTLLDVMGIERGGRLELDGRSLAREISGESMSGR